MQSIDYQSWKPLLLGQVTATTLKSEAYRHFIQNTVLAPGCRLLLKRHHQHPEWPYVETKFNPNTGLDLPPEAYNIVYAWFLGRGSEALDDHLRYLDQMDVLALTERNQVREVFSKWIETMTDTIVSLVEANHGRLPFRVTRAGLAVDVQGNPVQVNAQVAGAGDVFGLKGLLSSSDQAKHEFSRVMLKRAVELIRQERVENEQIGARPGRGQGMRMLLQGVGMCAARKALTAEARYEAFSAAAACMTDVLEAFYDPETAVFSEFVDVETGARGTYLDPGHANEFVGLGLGMIEALSSSEWAEAYQGLIERARRELPRILLKASDLGFNTRFPGLFKAVDNRDGTPLNTDMPWWNLPETMRAAVRACAVVDSDSERKACLDLYGRCHNAYFSQYLNRANGLFPVQTINGMTGRIADVVPAVPEGDPLYHANSAFLDLLDVVERL